MPTPPYYAVIFSSLRTTGDQGYGAMAQRMVELAREQPGFIGEESTRDAEGFGITVAYWSNPYRQAVPGNIRLGSNRILVGDSPDWYLSTGGTRDDRRRHRAASNHVMFDGRAVALPPAQVPVAVNDPASLR